MEYLVFTGALITLIGLAGLVYCIYFVWKARKQTLDDDAITQKLQKAVVWNLAAFFISAIGLMVVIFGVIVS